ncbi:hypothetical protein [Agarivorans sp.]|uniref:hypothetical protein n=1 Tax=Agarivorans sp. TaxID=1872412 RepID=UPI003D04CBF0
MKSIHLFRYALLSLLLISSPLFAATPPLQRVSYGEAQELNLSKIAQKTFLDQYSIDLAKKAALEWATSQGASHYSIYTIERSSLRSRYRVSIILYRL